MKFKMILLLLVFFCLFQIQVYQVYSVLNVTPAGDLYGKDYYNIFGYRNVTAIKFFGSYDFTVDNSGYCSFNTTTLSFNETKLNSTIQGIGKFTNTINVSNYNITDVGRIGLTSLSTCTGIGPEICTDSSGGIYIRSK